MYSLENKLMRILRFQVENSFCWKSICRPVFGVPSTGRNAEQLLFLTTGPWVLMTNNKAEKVKLNLIFLGRGGVDTWEGGGGKVPSMPWNAQVTRVKIEIYFMFEFQGQQRLLFLLLQIDEIFSNIFQKNFMQLQRNLTFCGDLKMRKKTLVFYKKLCSYKTRIILFKGANCIC